MIFTGIGVLLSVSISTDSIPRQLSWRPNFSQAASAVSTSRGELLDLFDRIENVFRRLEIYVEVPSTVGMTDAIVKVMVEVLCILAIVTKEIRQSRASESIPGY